MFDEYIDDPKKLKIFTKKSFKNIVTLNKIKNLEHVD